MPLQERRMQTEVISSDDQNCYNSSLLRVAAAVRDGALVVFPTETVYGVGANALNRDALARLRNVKGRRDNQAFTVHIPRRAEARRYADSPPPLARRLARKGWPGPLTLICPVPSPEQQEIAQVTPPGQLHEIYRDGKVGLRCPAHPVATELLREAGVPIVASSANRAGSPPPFDLNAALRDLAGTVEFALDAGRTRLNSASTIVEIQGREWMIRRTGALDERTIRRMATSEILMVCTGNSCRSPIAEHLFRVKLAERLGMPVEQLAAEGYVISSAGTGALPGGPISPGSREELAKRNVRVTQHRAQPLTIELIQRSERIYAMSPEHRAVVLDLVPSAADRVFALDEKGPIPDPIGGGPEEYRACAAQIERAVEARLEGSLHEDRDW
jgi:tRNA threonylcarbamoyl adenosine modification protein (Sua5/YciO/YrdC/YwlC family)